MTTKDMRKMISGSQPTASRSLILMLRFSTVPASSPWELAVKASNNAFWITIERPKVTITPGPSPLPTIVLRRPRWRR